MPDPSYVIETNGRKAGLEFHLQTAFYPALPVRVVGAFVVAFERYWLGETSSVELAQELEDNAGYIGGLQNYNFWQFLDEEFE